MSSRRSGHSRQKRTPSSGRSRNGIRITPPHGNEPIIDNTQEDNGLINWNVTPPRQHDRSSGSNSRAQIAGIFLGGLDARGRASTAEPEVLAALSEDPPGAVTGGCGDDCLLWTDFAGLDLVGAQFAVVSAGAESAASVLDNFELIGEDDVVGGGEDSSDSPNTTNDSFPSDDELGYIGGADSEDDSEGDSESDTSSDGEDMYADDYVSDDESTDDSYADDTITGGAIDILEDLLRDDLYYTGGDEDGNSPSCSTSIADDYKTAALLA